MQHDQHSCCDRRRIRLLETSDKTKRDDFYTKLERIRLATVASSSNSHRSATELLDETKRYFVKSQEVLHNRQTLFNNKHFNEQQQCTTISSFLTGSSCHAINDDVKHDRFQLDSLDLSLRSPIIHSKSIPTATTDLSNYSAFDSVSLLSLSDQTTLDSTNSLSNIKRTVAPPTSITVIERNARIIKWLFQLNKANASPTFQEIR